MSDIDEDFIKNFSVVGLLTSIGILPVIFAYYVEKTQENSQEENHKMEIQQTKNQENCNKNNIFVFDLIK